MLTRDCLHLEQPPLRQPLCCSEALLMRIEDSILFEQLHLRQRPCLFEDLLIPKKPSIEIFRRFKALLKQIEDCLHFEQLLSK